MSSEMTWLSIAAKLAAHRQIDGGNHLLGFGGIRWWLLTLMRILSSF